VTLTGLGLKFLVDRHRLCGGSLGLTALYTALIVWVVGLAVPVTASYIICAVIAAPALITLGVPDLRRAHVHLLLRAAFGSLSAHALSCFAAAAITGADPYKTTLQAWKYTMPAFVVPFLIVLDPMGTGPAAEPAEGRRVARRRVGRLPRLPRHRRARRVPAGLVHHARDARSTAPC
jgi:TRAP-type uncharacterized transport system fused permease subunit